jgi:hypothetical protein
LGEYEKDKEAWIREHRPEAYSLGVDFSEEYE